MLFVRIPYTLYLTHTHFHTNIIQLQIYDNNVRSLLSQYGLRALKIVLSGFYIAKIVLQTRHIQNFKQSVIITNRFNEVQWYAIGMNTTPL